MNPFGDVAALANSNFTTFTDGHLVCSSSSQHPTPLTLFVHDTLRARILNDQFPCHGGKAAVRQGPYGFGLYGALGSAASSAGLARDLFTFVTHTPSLNRSFTTYLASFAGPPAVDESEFERLLWDTLQQLHDLDTSYHDWDASVSADPESPTFSFSFGGVAFFVIGLHAASSRVARRFAWPTIVFNPHRQFDELKRTGQYARFQEVIRRAELELQGQINPMLSDHGVRSEAAQYSGRQVNADWQCPFHLRIVNEPTPD